VTLIDANVLLYAHNLESPHYESVSSWLRELSKTRETIGLPWITLWAFLRISTNPKIWPVAKSIDEAWEVIRFWLAQPGVVLVHPGPRHAEILEKLMLDERVSGAMVTDAVLAALAFEYGAVLASTDRGLRRFPNLRLVNPTAVKRD
jgi:toxin-antitoxin system PIN domain toxin